MEIEKNFIEHIPFRNGGEGIGSSETEKRINFLQFNFTNAYLRKALEYFYEMH